MAAATLTEEQWAASIQSIIDWIDPHVKKDDAESEATDYSKRSDPTPVRNAIELMRSVSAQGHESYANPAVHARYLHKTTQFSRIKISRFLAQEYDSPYLENHPILSHYFEIYNIKGESILNSLRSFFVKYKLDTPSNMNELQTLMNCFAIKYCHDNNEIRQNCKKNNTKQQTLNVNNINDDTTLEIDPKTKVFLGNSDELTKIYLQCMASQQSLHGTVAVGRVRANSNKFVETLNSELFNENVEQFSEQEMRKMFQGIKTWSLREEKIDNNNNIAGSKGDSEIVYSNNKSGSPSGAGKTNSSNEGNPPSGGTCCVIL